jgi:hypothetical protein
MQPGDAVNFILEVYTAPLGDAVNFELAVEMPPNFLIGFGVSGKLGEALTTDPLNIRGIYQMRMTKRGKRPIKMKFYVPTNPQTVPQEANRTKFAAAMAAWMALTTEQKNVYNARAKKRNMFGWGLFIREYYQAN